MNFTCSPLKLTITEAAEKLLITRPNLSAIVNGKAGISAVMALKLAKAFKTTPQYWMNLQANFGLWQAGTQSPTPKQKCPAFGLDAFAIVWRRDRDYLSVIP